MAQITLKAARVNANFNQLEAAKRLEIAVSTLRNWESGKTFPNKPQIDRICELYKIPFDSLFFAPKVS